MGVLEIIYSQHATTDIDAKYVKRRGSAQGLPVNSSHGHLVTRSCRHTV